MKAVVGIDNPNEIDVSVTITLKLKDWKLLRQQLGGSDRYTSYPIYKVIETVQALTLLAEKQFLQEDANKEDGNE